MVKRYEYELKKACDILMRDIFQLSPGESIVITADTESNEEVVNAAAASAHALGAIPATIWLAAADGVGKAADPKLPVEVLTGALSHADAWVEFNNKWLLYSTPFERAMAENKKLRYMCLVGMDPDLMHRTIGKIDAKALSIFLKRVTEMSAAASHIRVTTPAGTDIEFDTKPTYPFSCDDGDASTPGMHFLSGQVTMIPDFDTLNGTITFDGSIDPPCGLLKAPVHLKVERGVVVNISGGQEARALQTWLEAFDDPKMFRPVHCSYGFNPGAKLSGNILEDERVWGCTEWGLGYLSPLDAPPDGNNAKSHTDGICLNSSVWLDGHQILDEGKIIDPELKQLEAAIS